MCISKSKTETITIVVLVIVGSAFGGTNNTFYNVVFLGTHVTIVKASYFLLLLSSYILLLLAI